jgi:hypothetical protein
MRYLAIFFAISLSVFLSSCEEEMEVWDFASIEFTVCVQNADGDNLLDKDVPDNILDEDIYLEYNGKNMEMEVWNGSRYNPAYWYGLILQEDGVNMPCLHIGQFDVLSRHDECVLHIGGRSYKMAFDAEIKKHDVAITFHFDGKSHKHPNTKPTYYIVVE